MKNNKCFIVPLLVLLSLFCTSCAQVMAARQPSQFDPEPGPGLERNVVRAMIGHPVSTDEGDIEATDSFNYTDGGSRNHWGWKTLRVVGYTAGDLFTLFLSQLIWMPLEYGAFSPDQKYIVVTYTRDSKGVWRVKTFSKGDKSQAHSKKYLQNVAIKEE